MAVPIDLATPMLAVAVITVTAQVMGALAQRCHQPRVVGEIVGGIVLATGVFSFCGAYTLFGLNTCPLKAAEDKLAK
jgi:Kef-type K+ transport system membrane component KefB